MKLKPIKEYFRKGIKKDIRDGDNYYIKKYSTDGFKKAYEMWNDYSHDSIESFFNDFSKEYSDDFLNLNCKKCYEDMHNNKSEIEYDDLFDLLIRRLVIDAFVGFKFEDIIKENLVKNGIQIHNYNVISKSDERTLDYNYGIDVITFKNDEVSSLIQVKNTTTFDDDNHYIRSKRVEFFEKQELANEFIDDGKYRDVKFYVYNKDAFIYKNKYEFFVNPETDKCYFKLIDLVNEDGSLKFHIKTLKSREI